MKLSTKSRYAIMAMVDLAQQDNGSCVPLSLIAERQGLPLQYLEQLFSKLRRGNLVKSARGINGGYELAREANSIRIYDIILCTDAPVKVTRCNSHEENVGKFNIKMTNFVSVEDKQTLNQIFEYLLCFVERHFIVSILLFVSDRERICCLLHFNDVKFKEICFAKIMLVFKLAVYCYVAVEVILLHQFVD
jgi:Rrf2 family protein